MRSWLEAFRFSSCRIPQTPLPDNPPPVLLFLLQCPRKPHSTPFHGVPRRLALRDLRKTALGEETTDDGEGYL